MKTTILTLLCGSLGLVCAAQTRTDYDSKNKKLSLPPLVQSLQKGERYTVVLPQRLTYFAGDAQIRAEIGTPFVDIGGADTYKPTYTFELLADGIRTVKAADPRWYRGEYYDANQIPRPLKGFVRDYTCTFPCRLVVHKTGREKNDTLVISGNQTYTVTLHRDLLAPENTVAQPKAIMPFESQDQIANLEGMYHEAILKKVEQFAAAQLFRKAGAAITMLFRGNYSYETFGWGSIKTKRGAPSALPELDSAVASFRGSVDALLAGNYAEARRINAANATVLQALLADPRADKPVQEILHYNLAHAALLTKDFAAAETEYARALEAGLRADSVMAHDLRRLIDLLTLYDFLKGQLPGAPETL